MDPVSAEFVCTHVSPIPDSVHETNEKPSLKLLLEESRTPSTSVITRAKLYSLTNASLKTTMPETGTNGAVGGKNPVTGPPKTDDSANTRPRNKDSSNRGTPSHNNKRRGKDGPDGATPRKTPGRERYALLVGVEVIPQPGARSWSPVSPASRLDGSDNPGLRVTRRSGHHQPRSFEPNGVHPIPRFSGPRERVSI